MATGITVVFCVLILCLGVLCFFALWYYKRYFTDILTEVREARREVSAVGQKLDAEGGFAEKMTVLTTFDNIKLEHARNEYDAKYSVYLIPYNTLGKPRSKVVKTYSIWSMIMLCIWEIKKTNICG